LLLAAAGIPIVDAAGPEVLDEVWEGQIVRVEGSEVFVGARMVAKGVCQNLDTLEREYEAAKTNMADELDRLAENTLEYLRRERRFVLDAIALPEIATKMAGRHVLVVVRGSEYRRDLQALRHYIREMKPVLVAVDGGADDLLGMRLKPDLIIGDFDSCSEGALRCGAELVVHAYPGGRAPGAARLDAHALTYQTFEAPGTSEDIAMLLAFERGAELIVAVGSHASMIEFLEKGRAGMASTFLVRLKVGPILMDAKGMSRLYQSRVRKRDLAYLIGAVIVCAVVMVVVFPPLRVFLRGYWFSIRDAWHQLLH
jgi:uncharacterized membrane-anchored protein